MSRPNKPADAAKPRRYVDFTRFGLMRLLEEKERRESDGLAKWPVGALIDELVMKGNGPLPPCRAEVEAEVVVPIPKKPVVKPPAKRAPRRAKTNGSPYGDAVSA